MGSLLRLFFLLVADQTMSEICFISETSSLSHGTEVWVSLRLDQIGHVPIPEPISVERQRLCPGEVPELGLPTQTSCPPHNEGGEVGARRQPIISIIKIVCYKMWLNALLIWLVEKIS